MILPVALFVLKNDAPDLLSTCIINSVKIHHFEVPIIFFQVGNLSKRLCQQDAHRSYVLGASLNDPICLFPARNLDAFVDFANLGQNVNLKNGGYPKPWLGEIEGWA